MSTGTPIIIGFYPVSQSPVDERYLKDGTPYATTADVLSSIAEISRHPGLTVNIAGVEYWFLTDLTTLEIKSTSGTPTAAQVTITDIGDIFAATDVENALNEVKLISDANALALINLKQSVYEILLPASGSVAGRLSGSTVPSGWTIAASGAYNLLVTHTLTGRKLASVNIFEIDGANERLCAPFHTAFAGVLCNGLTVLIEGLNPSPLALRIELIFS
jgi:hypothetical protein